MRSFSVSSRPLLLSLCLLAPLVPSAALAADPPATFEGSSQVTSVEVPVNVVGKDGAPVRGLTAEDFEVYDGNERQTLTSFEVIDLKALETRLETAAQKAPADIPSAARRHILLLFDLSFSSPTSILKARLAAREFVLNGLHPADLAAVATFSLEQGPKLVITFTPDRAQLARAIDTLGIRRPTDRQVKNDPLRFIIETPDIFNQASGISDAMDLRSQREQIIYDYLKSITFASERSERSFEVGRITGYSRALADMARSLNAVKGRKQVIFFSEGFDSRLLLGRDTTEEGAEEDNINAMFGRTWMVDSDQRYGNTGLQGDVNKMLEEFRRADCVIQAVDIGGLRAAGSERARASGTEGLFYFANETGGELYKDANNLREPLERVLERSSVTYLLTFERSDLKLDGAYHRLKVKVNKLPPGARLAHRTGYYAPRPFQELDPLEKSLLASDGIATANPKRDIPLNVLSVPFRATATNAYVPVIIEVGGRGLLEGHAAKKLTVEFYTYVSDLQGQMRDFFTQRMTVDLDKGSARKSMLDGGIKYYGHFDLPTGSYRVRVLVRNADTGRTGVETVEVNVPTYAQALLLPPFFIEDRQKWLLLREQTGGELGTMDYPFIVGGEPYIPAARPVLHNQPARLCLVAYNLGKGKLAVQGEVVAAADGKSFPAGKLLNVERTSTGIPGLDKLVATFDPAGLDSGDYVLQVGVTDPATGLKHTNSLPFQIVR